ncbi:MAG: YHS domain-containing protein [Deltaproteobacteria bacterium]|nr:YHS domain-containing protein [Deltaproteobacteria bacterium]
MTKDPVCGMILSEEKAPFRYDYKGKVYFFCGKGCMERFEKDPEKYISGKGGDWVKG